MTVTFCGHRKIEHYLKVKNLLYLYTENLIRDGADTFLIGSYGEFDLLAAETIHNLKTKYPHIKSINIIPYTNKKTNNGLFDEYKYAIFENINPKYAIIKANEYMVDKSNIVIAYIKRNTGGAFKTYCYAMRKQKRVIWI